MKTVFLVSSLLLLVAAISQCGNHSTKTSNSILGRYELTGRDNSGQVAFTGTISFVSLEQNQLKGQCKIIREQNAPEGLYEKDGTCEALMDGKRIDLDSAPLLDDAGLLLEGEFDGVAVRGIWRLDGLVTSEPLGKFEAVKKMEGGPGNNSYLASDAAYSRNRSAALLPPPAPTPDDESNNE